MKGDKKVIRQLNLLLADELSAINQYIVHAEMCAGWGYKKLHDAIQARAIEEMKHAEKLISRIIFLEGHPALESTGKIRIGKTVEEQLKNDLSSEHEAVAVYNDNIRLAMDHGDHSTADLLRSILRDEEKHIDWLEAQLSIIGQTELKNYLVGQAG
jgi:bacterioferritin